MDAVEGISKRLKKVEAKRSEGSDRNPRSEYKQSFRDAIIG
jgi:hypothetical protein